MTVKPEDIQLSPGKQQLLIPRLQERVLSCPIGRSALDYPQDRHILLLNGENDG